MAKVKDITGNRYGRLMVVGRAEKNGTNGQTRWICLCDCGNRTIVHKSNLTSGDTRSCGCLAKETARKQETKHGKSRTRLYRIWIGMKDRCGNPNNPHYGGRGITVCDEWQSDFEAFYRWAISNGYKNDLTIDRIDNDGNYEPSNCRWVTGKQNSNNKSNNKKYEYEGQEYTIPELSRMTGINASTIRSRLKAGWSIARAIGKESGNEKNGKSKI